MIRSKLLYATIMLVACTTNVFAGSSQNGPIGPGSRDGLQPSVGDKNAPSDKNFVAPTYARQTSIYQPHAAKAKHK